MTSDLDALVDELIATAQPRTFDVPVCARGDLVKRHVELAEEWEATRKDTAGSIGGDAKLSRIEQEIRDVEAEQERLTVVITVSSVSRREWADLLAAHPPRREDKARGRDFNEDTFPPAAIALCTPLSIERVNGLGTKLSPAEWGKLFNTAVLLNSVEMPHPKLPAATEIARANTASSTTRLNGESHAPSS